MKEKAVPRQDIRIVGESRSVTFPEPGVPRIVVLVSYMADIGPPRTVQIPLTELPDVVWRDNHPAGPEPSKDLLARGDEVRRAAIRADLDRRQAAPPIRTLSV